MPISADEAAANLRDIAQAETRSRELKGYEIGSPYLILWGVIWVVGYSAPSFLGQTWWVWPVLNVIGIAASVFVGVHQARTNWLVAENAVYRRRAYQILAGWFVLMIFVAATYAILKPQTANQLDAFPGILLGTVYALVGVRWLPRYLVLGAGIFFLTLFGFFYVTPWFSLWMAVVGGGGLILGGLWLRKA